MGPFAIDNDTYINMPCLCQAVTPISNVSMSVYFVLTNLQYFVTVF